MIGLPPINNPIVDTVSLAREVLKTRIANLDYLCRRFNIDLSRRTKHNALLDCELLREVYINLLDAKEPKFNLSSNISDKNLSQIEEYNKSIVKVSEEELTKHKSFLKSELKKNFY